MTLSLTLRHILVSLGRSRMRSDLAIPHFAARGGDLVHLVCLVHFVYLVSENKIDTTNPHTR